MPYFLEHEVFTDACISTKHNDKTYYKYNVNIPTLQW